MNLRNGMKILFQGDSITDGGRSRNEDQNHVMGHGYAYLVAARLGADFPERELRFYNRGISGNRVVDLYARWREDALNLEPDLISVLVGVNDVGAEMSRSAGVSKERYLKVYRLLIEETAEALPGCGFVICEPFFLPHPNRNPNNDTYVSEVAARGAAAREIADEYGAVFVELQHVFDSACGQAPAEYWLWDGVHPTPQGHELIARAWTAEVFGEGERVRG